MKNTSLINDLGLTKTDYQGAKSTLCTGCGHDSITSHIVAALFQNSIKPSRVAKLSGIGCSSKTPTYFLSQSHGFNTIHGRMAPVATGVHAVAKDLTLIGISGDGDSASIGLGGFAHLIRRDVPMVYLVENNGVYGLTKGQFSATADKGTTLKGGEINPFTGIDLCGLAIELGCHFVARSFSGDGKQLQALLSAALHHRGTALIDVISPCVTFANHPGSSKSFHSVKDHNLQLQELGFIPARDQIKVNLPDGDVINVTLHDGATLTLRKIKNDFDHTSREKALAALNESQRSGEILTGLLYFNRNNLCLTDNLDLVDTPLNQLSAKELEVSSTAFAQILRGFS